MRESVLLDNLISVKEDQAFWFIYFKGIDFASEAFVCIYLFIYILHFKVKPVVSPTGKITLKPTAE